MSLADYTGQWLDAGWHDVRVIKAELFTANSGNRGVNFYVVAGDGRTSKTRGFMLTLKAMVYLASFARACGLTDAEMKGYDECNEASHQQLVNREVRVLVQKVKGYHEATDWAVADGSPMPVPPPPPPEPNATSEEPDCPF